MAAKGEVSIVDTFDQPNNKLLPEPEDSAAPPVGKFYGFMSPKSEKLDLSKRRASKKLTMSSKYVLALERDEFSNDC